jgi:hypothetical protein
MPTTPLVGCEARVATTDGTVLEGRVTEVSAHPLSQEEIAGEQTDAWMAYLLATSPFGYRVTIDDASGDATDTPTGTAVGDTTTAQADSTATGDTTTAAADTIAEVTIVTSEERLISFLFN